MGSRLSKHVDDFANFTKQDHSSFPDVDGFKPQSVGLSEWIDRVTNAIVRTFLGSSDPFVWQKSDRQSNLWWIIDNPLIGNSPYALSEDDIRVWIEHHYYAQPEFSDTLSKNVNLHFGER